MKTLLILSLLSFNVFAEQPKEHKVISGVATFKRACDLSDEKRSYKLFFSTCQEKGYVGGTDDVSSIITDTDYLCQYRVSMKCISPIPRCRVQSYQGGFMNNKTKYKVTKISAWVPAYTDFVEYKAMLIQDGFKTYEEAAKLRDTLEKNEECVALKI